jgi:hypothetical protein
MVLNVQGKGSLQSTESNDPERNASLAVSSEVRMKGKKRTKKYTFLEDRSAVAGTHIIKGLPFIKLAKGMRTSISRIMEDQIS